MTDLDNTQIMAADDSLLQNEPTVNTEASLKIIGGADSNTYQIGKETIIGRSNPSDIVISAPSLSKQHAKISFNNGQYFITDLASSNKTLHNKIQLQPHVCYALHNGDEIKLGDIICSFEEQTQTNINTASEPTYQTYIPAANTLVEEDSPWPSDDEVPSPLVVSEKNVDMIPSTQTITDSYDDQEPTQPMKIWNGNSDHSNRLSRTSIKSSEDVTRKQNGLNDSPSNKSSAFIPPSSTSISNNTDNDDDGSLVIGATTLPATVPLVIESTQLNNDDQLEIISSSQTKKVVNEDNHPVSNETTTPAEVEINDTQAYTLEPTGETNLSNDDIAETQAYTLESTDESNPSNDDITETQAYTLEPTGENNASSNYITETQPYELESEQIVKNVVETKCEEVQQVVINGDTIVEQITTTTTTTTTTITENENPPMQTLSYDLEPTVKETAITTVTTAATVENEDLPMDTLAYELEPTNNYQVNLDAVAPTVCADTQAYDLDEETAEVSPRPASETLEVIPVSELVEQLQDVESVVDDSTPKQQVEITINQDIIKESVAEDLMDIELHEHPSTSVNNKSETDKVHEQQKTTDRIDDSTVPVTNSDQALVDETKAELQPTTKEQEPVADLNKSFIDTPVQSEQQTVEAAATSLPEDSPPSTLHIEDNEQEEIEGEEGEEVQEPAPVSGRGQRGVPRKAARRARGRRGGAARARVVSTRLHGRRRNAVVPTTNENEDNNATLEETINTESEESPKKLSETPEVAQKSTESKTTASTPSTPADEPSLPSQTNSGSNVRVSARIKARASSGRNRQFPYTDDYVDLDDLEKQTKTLSTPAPTTASSGRRSTRGGRSSSAPQKRISLRQQPIDATESPDEKSKRQKESTDIYEQMDVGGENEEPVVTKSAGRKRKSTTPVASTTSKRTRSTTPQTAPITNAPRNQTPSLNVSTSSPTVTPKRGRKSTKEATPIAQSPEKQTVPTDRPVRIALSSHLNFDQSSLETLRKLGFEIMDESCKVDALVVDRIRRTKKFFMCLARGAHILSPTWIEAMIKENRYISYDKYYLEDNTAETRYGFQLRDSVRLAKQHPIFENYKVFCTKDTSPPYDDLKDIVEAAGGKFIEKVNTNKPGKDLICIVAQVHKSEYEELFKKGVPIVSEEFALSGISKQKLDFDAFSLFQNTASTVKTTGSK